MYDHRGGNGIKVEDNQFALLGRAMSHEVMKTLVKKSLELGLKPYVHIGVWDDASKALRAGARIFNHFGDKEIPKELLKELIFYKNHVYWIPTLAAREDYINLKLNKILTHSLLVKLVDHKLIKSYNNSFLDAHFVYLNHAYKMQKKYATINIKKLARAGFKFVVGSDIPEPGTIIGWSTHREIYLLVKYGLSPWEALGAATTNAHDLLGLKAGLEPGTKANILVLNSSPIQNIINTGRIYKIIHNGVVIYSYK
jgi:imidazolonepropionase-like amidohydrolase